MSSSYDGDAEQAMDAAEDEARDHGLSGKLMVLLVWALIHTIRGSRR